MARPEDLECNLVFAIGGYDCRESLKTTEVLNLSTSKWEVAPPMTTGRRGAAVVMYDMQILVLGGYGDGGFGEGCLNTTEVFDIATWEWRAGVPMPNRRCELAAGILGGSIFAAGGRGNGDLLRLVEEFDIGERRWEPSPPLQKARGSLATASQGGRLFAIGGDTGSDGDLGSKHVEEVGLVEIFEPEKGAWYDGPPMLMRRCNPAVSVWGERIFVVGGFGSRFGGAGLGAGFLDTIEVFDTATWAWEFGPRLCHYRSGLGVAIMPSADKMLVLGGPFAGVGHTTVEVFDMNTMERTSAPKLPSQRWGMCVVAHDGDTLREKRIDEEQKAAARRAIIDRDGGIPLELRTDDEMKTAVRCAIMEAIALRDVPGLRAAMAAGEASKLETEELAVGTQLLKNYDETGWLAGSYRSDLRSTLQFSAVTSATSNPTLSDTSFLNSVAPATVSSGFH